jgi:hypothetical protein
VVLIPSLALLFSLYLRGRLYLPDRPAPAPDGSAPASAVPLVAASADASASSGEGAGSREGGVEAREDDERGERVLRLATVRAWGGAAGLGLVAGTGLLVFADASWAHLLGVALLSLCAVSVFRLTSTD